MKSLLKKYYPHHLAALVYDCIMSPFSKASAAKLTGSFPPNIDIYHETTNTVLFKNIPSSCKIIAEVHDLSAFKYPDWHEKKYVDDFRASLPIIIKASHIISKSCYVKRELIDAFGINENRITVVPNAPSPVYTSLADKTIARRYVDTYFTRKPYIFFVGTIEPRKNLEVLFRALKKVLQHLDIDLIIAGGQGWRAWEIMKRPDDLGIAESVKFIGYATEEEILYLHNAASAFVMPSLYEGFGIPPIEAMACGTPVIVANSSSLPEITGSAALHFERMTLMVLQLILNR